MLRPVLVAVTGLERRLAWLLLRAGGPVQVHPFHGYAAGGQARVGGRVLVGAPPRSTRARAAAPASPTRSGRWAVVRANLLPFLTVEVPFGAVRVAVGGRQQVVRTDGDGYLRVTLEDAGLPVGPQSVVLTPVDPPGPPTTAILHVLDERTELAVVSDVDDTIVDSGIAHGLAATLTTMLLQEQSTRVPLDGAATLYRSLAAGSSSGPRPFFYLSTSPWNLAGFLQSFLVRHGFPPGPLLLTDWGPGASGLLRASSRTHKLGALRELAQQLPATSFVLIGDTGQQDPTVYAEFAREHPGRVTAVYIRRAGAPGPLADSRAERATQLLRELGVPFLVAHDSGEMLVHARDLGLIAAGG